MGGSGVNKNVIMDSDAPGFSEWASDLASGKTHLGFEKWKEDNKIVVKRAKRRIKEAEKREKARKAAEREKIVYEAPRQFKTGGYKGPSLFSSVRQGYSIPEDQDSDAFAYLSGDT